MKKSLVSFALLSITSIASISASAEEITFKGLVTAQTCTINNGVKNFDVILPTVSAQALPDAGTTTGATRFNISLTNCTPGGGKVKAFFSHATGANENGRLKNIAAGGAANVDVELVTAENATAIVVGGDGSQGAPFVALDASGNATLTYAARYHAVGKAGPGAVLAKTVYTIAYQ